MTPRRPAYLRHFAAKGVIWRRYLDWAITNIPFFLQPVMLTVWTFFSFLFAVQERRALVRNLSVVRPDSPRAITYFRAFRTLLNFAWTVAEAANYRVNNAEFAYEIVGPDLLDRLGRANGAIVLTAHMGNYDLGAALFAEKFQREIRMVRAPEPDEQSAHHLNAAVQQSGEGAVKIAYSGEGALLSFDLLGALRAGEIVSIQGDRIIEGVASAQGEMFGRHLPVPSGPFTLAQVAQVPIFPLFIVRAGFRSYQIIVREPIVVRRTARSRDEDIAVAVAAWCALLEQTIARHWHQWFALAPVFTANGNE